MNGSCGSDVSSIRSLTISSSQLQQWQTSTAAGQVQNVHRHSMSDMEIMNHLKC